jgi:hypothetical protein
MHDRLLHEHDSGPVHGGLNGVFDIQTATCCALWLLDDSPDWHEHVSDGITLFPFWDFAVRTAKSVLAPSFRLLRVSRFSIDTRRCLLGPTDAYRDASEYRITRF